MKEVGYFALFADQPEGGFTVTFPDVAGAISEGDDLEQAWFNAREALELILEARAEAGEPLPAPRTMDATVALAVAGEAVLLVTGAAPANAVRINVTMDEGLLERVNRRVEETGQSRSAFIAEAVRKSLRESA